MQEPATRQGQAWAEDRYLQALQPVTHAETGQARHPYALQVRNSHPVPAGG